MADNVFSNVVKSLVLVKGIDEKKVKKETLLIGDLGFESIDIVDLVFELEQQFNLTLDLADLAEKMKKGSVNFRSDLSVAALVDFVESKLG